MGFAKFDRFFVCIGKFEKFHRFQDKGAVPSCLGQLGWWPRVWGPK